MWETEREQKWIVSSALMQSGTRKTQFVIIIIKKERNKTHTYTAVIILWLVDAQRELLYVYNEHWYIHSRELDKPDLSWSFRCPLVLRAHERVRCSPFAITLCYAASPCASELCILRDRVQVCWICDCIRTLIFLSSYHFVYWHCCCWYFSFV